MFSDDLKRIEKNFILNTFYMNQLKHQPRKVTLTMKLTKSTQMKSKGVSNVNVFVSTLMMMTQTRNLPK